MRNFLFLAVGVVCSLVLATRFSATATTGAAEKPDAAAPRVEPSQIEAAELAEYLGISASSFRYSGRLARAWVEIIDGDQKTLVPNAPEDHPNLKAREKDQTGRINLCVKPGDVTLKISGAYPASYTKTFGTDALWWGWRSWTIETQRRSDGLSPRPGDEVTLLRHVVTGDTDNGARKIEVLLKAKFAGDAQ